MSVEKRFQRILDEENELPDSPQWLQLNDNWWEWVGRPYSKVSSRDEARYWVNKENHTRVYKKIDDLIKEASFVECLSSPFLYIRECKKWFNENKE